MKRTVQMGMAIAGVATLWLGNQPASAQQPVATATATVATNAAPPAITARIRVDEKERETRDVEFVGREGDKLFYRLQGGPREASTTLNPATLQEVDFDLRMDETALSQALVARNWSGAAAILYPVILPLIPYLDLKDNNAADYALELGSDMVRAAEASRAKGGDTNKVNRLYLEAHRILTAVTTAAWFGGSELARLHAIQCRIALGDLKLAARELEAARDPEVGDASFGLYWLVQAQLLQAKGDTRGCMDAAVKSLTFADKDIDTFPDALMLSARCYESLLEVHRARDVYYEVVRLFGKTEWEPIARQKLQALMDSGQTKVKEVSPVENVFFGLDEDMDAKALALLKGADETVPEVPSEDQIKDDKDPDVTPAKSADDAAPDAPPPAPRQPAAPARPALAPAAPPASHAGTTPHATVNKPDKAKGGGTH